MDSCSAKFHVVVSGNNNSVVSLIPYPTQQFDLDDAITMPENHSVMIPYSAQQFDLDQAITMMENPQSRQQEVAGLVSDMPTVNHAAGICSVCMVSFKKSEETARRISVAMCITITVLPVGF
ncbi:hypothetical protein F3Y22_tig00111002pilonHSYRG00030 [Hibiscus syriacus]|uniref:Uncharacterized protein n=1 Tax=Hibiscus syriacus TaxID=106335 RepID=A0A6A2Z946_HIBSY|nr:hypothetical protein F3Y22_tig00111002pilonHSYRG00030 [Hibiscus syriacus]